MSQDYVLIAEPDPRAARTFMSFDMLCEMLALSPNELLGQGRHTLVERLCALSASPEDLRRRLHVHADGPYVAREEFELSHPTRRVLRWTARPVRVPEGVLRLAVYTDVTAEVDTRVDDLTIFLEDDA